MSYGVELWSDFDGTAVEKLNKWNLRHARRNSMKRNLAPLEGYADFLGGVQSVGVDLAGVVSKRGERRRRAATMASVAELGLEEIFTADRIKLLGSEKAKGQFVAERSKVATVAMIEDRPHKLGPVVLGAVVRAIEDEEVVHQPIVLGVVAQPNAQEYVNRFIKSVDEKFGGISVGYSPVTFDGEGHNISASGMDIHVGVLEPYSSETGRRFGQELGSL